MNKLRKAFTAIREILKNPYLLNHVIDEELYWKKKVMKKHGFRYGLPQITITDLLGEFQEKVFPYAFLDGSSSPLDLVLLKGLVRKFGVKDYFEIGTWRGESAANVAPLVKNCFTLNLPDESMQKMGLDEDYIRLHRFFSKNIPNVTHLQADSLTFDFGSLDKKFDVVFIDGDHHYPSVKSDTEKVFGILKDEKSMVVWHDYAANPEKIRWSVLCGILDGWPPGYHKNLYHVSNTLCAVFLPDKLYKGPSSFLKSNNIPDKAFELTIRPEKIS